MYRSNYSDNLIQEENLLKKQSLIRAGASPRKSYDLYHDHLLDSFLGDELLPLASSAVVSLEDDKAQSLLSLLGADTTKEFYEAQWILLAPVFRRGEHLVLDDAVRLPIIKPEPIAKGAYGGVHRVEIHPDHLNLEASAFSLSQKVSRGSMKLPESMLTLNRILPTH